MVNFSEVESDVRDIQNRKARGAPLSNPPVRALAEDNFNGPI